MAEPLDDPVAPLAAASGPVRRRGSLTAPVLVALATVYIVWGSTYFAIRVALESFPPFVQGGLRFLTAGGLLFAFLLLRRTPLPTRREWRDGAVVGVLLLAVGNGSVSFAEQHVSSSLAAIFIGATPLAAALWSGAFGSWPSRVQWVGIAIGFTGVVALSGGAQFAAQPAGLLALTLAVAGWTFGSALSQRKLKLAPGAMGFATEMLAGGAVMLALGIASGEFSRFIAGGPPTPAAVAALLYLIFAGSIAAFSAYMYLLSQVSATIATSYAYVNPLIAVLLGVLFGGESLTMHEAIATVVIVASVILLTRGRRA